MSDPSPLTEIKQWFTSQPDDIQRELALLVGTQLLDVEARILWDPKQSIALLLDWMDDTGNRYRRIGKMLCFKACLDNVLRKRDSAEGWAESEAFLRSVALEGDTEMQKSTADMLARHPVRAAQWIELSADWYDLSARIFAYDELDAWSLKA